MPRRPTIIDVARVAGVSKTTVGRVINEQNDLVREETRKQVLEAIEQLGYERNSIAGSLRTDRTFTIALSIPDITNPFWPEVARGVQDTAEEEGYTVVIMNSDWDVRRQSNHLSAVKRNRFDGLVVNPVGVPIADLANLGIPVVVLSGTGNYSEFDAVGSDSEMAVHTALAHLLDLGHRRIGLITGVPQSKRPSTRYASYESFYKNHDLPLDDDLIVRCEFSQAAGGEAVLQLLGLDSPPTAVCAGNDILAIGALLAAQQAGVKVPDQLSIIGLDDIPAAAMTYPSLTTVSKPKYDIGVAAATVLLERIRGKLPESLCHRRLPCHLVLRQSTAPINAG